MSGVSVAKKNGGQTSAIFANDTRWRPNSQILHRRDRSNLRVTETARPSGVPPSAARPSGVLLTYGPLVTIWHHRIWSVLVQVMPCWPEARHYWNHHWLIMRSSGIYLKMISMKMLNCQWFTCVWKFHIVGGAALPKHQWVNSFNCF